PAARTACKHAPTHGSYTLSPHDALPISAGFRGIINLFSGRAHIYKPGTTTGEYDESDVPPEEQERFERWRMELIEAIAATDDTRSEEHTSELQSRENIVCRLLPETKSGR